MSGELPFCASVRVRTAPHFTVVPLPLVLLPSSDSLVSWPPSMIPSPSPCSYASSPRPLPHGSLLHAVYMYIHTSLPILSFTSTLLPVHTSFLLHYTPLPIPLLPCCPLQHQSALCILVVATLSHIGHMTGSTCLLAPSMGSLDLFSLDSPLLGEY